MEIRTFLLLVIAILGFISGLLGFIAEGKKLVESDITRLPSDECVHGRGPALALGMVAAVALLIAQIISNSLGGCICCESGASDPSGKSTPTAVAISFLTLSWITFSIAFLLLVAGASINDRRDPSDDNLSTGCFVLKSGVFTGAAFASMTTAVLGIAYNLQVFSIRKNMGSVGSRDGGPSSSEVMTNSGNLRRSAMTSQEFMATARPVFSSEQMQKTKAMHDHRSAYPRSAVIPKRDMGILEMGSPQSEEACANDLQGYTHMRGTLANTELDDMQISKQMRKSLLLQQQGYPCPDSEYYHEKEEGHHGSQHASQSASAAYNTNGRDASHLQYDNDQDALRPLYIRSGDGNVWEQ